MIATTACRGTLLALSMLSRHVSHVIQTGVQECLFAKVTRYSGSLLQLHLLKNPAAQAAHPAV